MRMYLTPLDEGLAMVMYGGAYEGRGIISITYVGNVGKEARYRFEESLKKGTGFVTTYVKGEQVLDNDKTSTG